jgi:hypothetical protein
MDNPGSMESPDTILTRTIVGSPVQVTLGRRHGALRSAAGMGEQATQRVAQAWDDLVVLHRPDEILHRPRRKPGPVRRWLERQALAVLLTGLAMLGGAVALTLTGGLR